MHRKITFVLTTFLLLLLTACQPIQPVPPVADESSALSSPVQAAALILPDGATCAWAGEGATLAFDGKRANYTCAESDEEIIALLGDPTPGETGVWSVEKATISHGDDGFTLESRETITFLAATLALADGTQCAFAGRGATLAFDEKRLNYTCGEPGTEIIGILGELTAGEAGVLMAEKVVIARSGNESTIQESTQVAVSQITGVAVEGAEGATEGTAAMTENELVGVVWQWQRTEMSDDTTFTPEEPANYTLTFLPDSRLQIQADCNRGGGAYTLDGNQLTIGPAAMTLMACPPDSLGDTFAQQLGEVLSYLLEGDNLVLTLAVDSGSMIFAPAADTTAAPVADGAATATLTGTVTYLQRMALVAGAVVEVQLLDDTGAVIAGQRITTTGENVPIPFELSYNPAQIDEQGAYTLRATIMLEGQVRWANTEPPAVLTNGAPTSGVEILVQPAR